MATRLQGEMWTAEMNRPSFAVSGMNMAFCETCEVVHLHIIDLVLSTWKRYLIQNSDYVLQFLLLQT